MTTNGANVYLGAALVALFTILFCVGLALWHFLKTKYMLMSGIRVDGRVIKKRYELILSGRSMKIPIPTIVFSYYVNNMLMVGTQHVREQHYAQLEEGQLVPIVYIQGLAYIAILAGKHVDFWEVRWPLQWALLAAIILSLLILIGEIAFALLAAVGIR